MTTPSDDRLRVRLKRLDEELHRRRNAEEELRQSGERLRLLVEHGREIVYCLRLGPPRFEYISPIVADILGTPAGEFYADPGLALELVHADDRALLHRYLDAADFHRPLTLRCLRRDGTVVWIEQRGVPSYDDRGQLVAIEGIARDVSQYRKLLENLEERAPSIEERERLVSAFRRIGSATIASLDLDHVLDTLTKEVVRAGIFPSLMVAVVDQRTRSVRVERNYLSSDGQYEDVGTSYDLNDGSIIPTVARSAQLTVIDADDCSSVSYFIPIQRDGRVLAVLATGSDSTERVETLRRIEVMEPLLEQAAVALDHAFAHASLRSHASELHDLNHRLREEISRRERVEETLRDFSGRTVHLAEEERRRVARKLHDGVNQLLCAVGFSLDSVSREVNGNASARVGLERSRQVLDQTIQEVRRISQDLRPGVLDHLGLAAAARSLCEEFRKRTGIPISHDVSRLPTDVPPEVAITVYRLLQESLYNLERQHGAGVVRVRLAIEDGDLVSEVIDEGRVAVGQADGDTDVLRNLRDRADLLGGRLSLEGIPEGGSRLVVRLPLQGRG